MFITLHWRLQKFKHSSDIVFHAAGMEQQSPGRRLNVDLYNSMYIDR